MGWNKMTSGTIGIAADPSPKGRTNFMGATRPHARAHGPARSPLATTLSVIILGLALCLASASSESQTRYVIVNGALMNPQQMAILDTLAGATVPNGNYWLNVNNGIWGYAGNPTPQGQLGARQNGGANHSGSNYRGPFGDYMSDGNCSFVNGIPVGNC